jgi:hypothetical protein
MWTPLTPAEANKIMEEKYGQIPDCSKCGKKQIDFDHCLCSLDHPDERRWPDRRERTVREPSDFSEL